MAASYALVVGESLVDVLPGPGGPTAHPGGSPLNVAVGLARLGHATRLATWFGRDAYGRAITDHLQASGVRLVAGSDDAPRTSSATVMFDDAGSASYVFDLTWQMPALPEGEPPLLVHTGSIGAVLSPGGPSVLAAMHRLREAGVIVSFDPNVRPAVMGDEARALIEGYVGVAHVVKASDEDLAFLYPGEDAVDVARRWAGAGPDVVVVTRGARGALGLAGAASVEVGPPSVGVVDTVGAGDAFMAGLLHALWPFNNGLGEAALRDVLGVATRAAGLALSRAGADPAWLSELA